MKFFINRWFLLFCTILASFSIYYIRYYETHDDLIKTYRLYLQENNAEYLYPLIRRSVGTTISLNEVQELAKEYNNTALDTAVTACQNYDRFADLLSQADFLQLAFFIEAHKARFSAHKKLYIDKEKSFLSHNLEYYRPQDAVFIILDGPNAKIGKGKKKLVTKAIFYDCQNPQIVARLEQTSRMNREISVTKKMQSKPGIFEILGFGKHKARGATYKTIYSKLYNAGSLYKALQTTDFTFKEKVLIAENILKGLAALHAKKIVHRDLGTKNYLVDIQTDVLGHRRVTCCIADLGRGNFIHKVKGSKPQGNTSYTAPEALFRDKLPGKAYYKTDVYAVGLVLYWLYYGKRAPWQDSKYVKDQSLPLKVRHKMLVEALTDATAEVRQKLKEKGSLTATDAFEAIIFNMLECDPQERLTADTLAKKMEQIAHPLSGNASGLGAVSDAGLTPSISDESVEVFVRDAGVYRSGHDSMS